MKAETKQNWKFIGKTLETYLKQVWRGSTQNLRFVGKLLKNTGKAVPDIIQLVGNIATGDAMDAIDEVIDILDHLDVLESGLQVTADDIKYTIKNFKEYEKFIKQHRKENIKMEKKKKKSATGKASTSSSRIHSIKTAAEQTARTNHPEWYMRDKTMLSSLVGINISNRQNASMKEIRNAVFDQANTTPYITQFSIPSGAGIRLELCIPKSNTNDWQQGINLLYKNIRSANAGAINYSPSQLANYIFTVRSIDCVLSSLGRAIRTLNSGSFYDAVSPQSFFRMYGLDYDSFADNAANARELYNRLAAIRYRLMPLNISLLDRTRWLFSNVFNDSDDAKAQHYAFYATRIYYISSKNIIKVITIADDTVQGTGTTGMTWDDFSSAALSIFDDYQTDSVFQIIAGDILKAYGKEALTAYPEIYQHDSLKPIFDEHVLTQIQNATLSITGTIGTEWNADETDLDKFVVESLYETVVQVTSIQPINGDTVAFPNQLEETFNPFIINPLYNSNQDVTDPGRLLSSTRLMASRHAVNAPSLGDVGTILYDTYGTEVVEMIRVVVYTETAPDFAYNLLTFPITFVPFNGRVADGISTTSQLPAWSWFDYFPAVLPKLIDNVNNRIVYGMILFDFNNFGIAYKSNLDSYNAIATLSMLHKPFISRVNKTEVFDV